MNHEIQPVPLALQHAKHFLQLGIVADVAGQDQARADAFRQRTHALSLRLALIGEGEFRAVRGECARNAPSDGMIVRDAHDEALSSRHQPAGLRNRVLNHSSP